MAAATATGLRLPPAWTDAVETVEVRVIKGKIRAGGVRGAVVIFFTRQLTRKTYGKCLIVFAR